jgi:hypothetical protein
MMERIKTRGGNSALLYTLVEIIPAVCRDSVLSDRQTERNILDIHAGLLGFAQLRILTWLYSKATLSYRSFCRENTWYSARSHRQTTLKTTCVGLSDAEVYY